MPKQVDHRARRALIASALVRVAARHGLDAVSLRHVAAEAEVSAGMVQHYFRTKDEMMAFALDVVREHGTARVTAAVERLGPTPDPRDVLRSMILAILPFDDESRDYARVALAFHAYTAVRPEAGAGLRTDAGQMLTHVADLIAMRHPTPDPLAAAAALLALMEGLGVQMLGGHYTDELARRALDTHLDMLFGEKSG